MKNKITVLLSPEFINLVQEIHNETQDVSRTAVLAERRWMYRDIKNNADLVVLDSDIEMILGVLNDEGKCINSNLYVWLYKNMTSVIGDVKDLTINTVNTLWSNYSAYVTSNGLDTLLLKTKQYKSENPLFSIFGVLCKLVIDRKKASA